MNPTRRELLAASATSLAAAAPSKRPNVLYVFSDEHRACSMPGEPHNQAITPNLERFSTQALTLNNCISNYPVCSPYRAMLLTGRWPYQTGIIDNAINLGTNEVSLGHSFKNAGYRTGYIGKWHLSASDEGGGFIPAGPARQGFDDWHVWSNTNQHFDKSFTFDPDTGKKLQPKGYNATLMTDQALDFIGKNKDKPWMLTISWNPPHPNFTDAPPAQQERYQPDLFDYRPNVKKAGNLAQQLQGYYGHITAIDIEFNRLIRRLEETGQVDNTIVIYTSDHGDMMGSHGFGGKRLPWDESCKVPFMVRYPKVVPNNSKLDGLFSTIDIYPTVCGLAGIPVPKHCQGRDLSAALSGKPINFPESSFLMHIAKDGASGGENHPAPLFRGVRTAQYTYAVADDGRWLLYDNREDPFQMHNLIDDPTRAKLTLELDGLTADWLTRAKDPFPLAQLRSRRSKH